MSSNIKRFNIPKAPNTRVMRKPNRPMSASVVKQLPKGSTIDYTSKGIKQVHVINIDSRARDLNKFSDPNSYRIKLKRNFKNVVKIELVTAEIPHTDFVINEYNNKLDVDDNSTTREITIPVGDYDCNELANELATQLNAVSPATWTISFDNGKFTFASTANFSLLFSSGTNADSIKTSTDGYNIGYLEEGLSIRRTLGFTIADTPSAMSATGTNKINLGGENYIILELGPDVRENLDWFDDSGHSAFGKIVFCSDLNVVQYYHESEYNVSRSYDPPLGKLDSLYVKFRTYGGRLYNFRGHEHSFMLRVTTKE